MKRWRLRRSCLCLTVVVFAVGLYSSGCERRAATAPPTLVAEGGLKELKFAPMEYFENQCAHCHGPYGTMYGPRTPEFDGDAALLAKILSMSRNQGQSPVTDAQAHVLLAYERSMATEGGQKGTLFAAVVELKGQVLLGEVTPEAEVRLLLRDGTEHPAAVDGHQWRVDLGPRASDLRERGGLLQIRKGTSTLAIDLSKTAFSP